MHTKTVSARTFDRWNIIVGLLTLCAFIAGCSAADTDITLDAKATLNHRIQSLDLLVFVFLLALTVLTIWLFKHHRVSWLHETGLAVIYGECEECGVRGVKPKYIIYWYYVIDLGHLFIHISLFLRTFTHSLPPEAFIVVFCYHTFILMHKFTYIQMYAHSYNNVFVQFVPEPPQK